MTPSWKYRLHQALWYEGLALLWVLPIVEKATGIVGTAFWLLLFLSILVCSWTAIFNAVFDKFFQASLPDTKRHWKIRTIHVVLFELSVVGMTTPIVSWWTGLAIEKAIVLNAQISLFYIVYTYVFFFVWDKIVLQLHRKKLQQNTPT